MVSGQLVSGWWLKIIAEILHRVIPSDEAIPRAAMGGMTEEPRDPILDTTPRLPYPDLERTDG